MIDDELSDVPETSDFTQSMDATVWAKAFVDRAKKNPNFATDEGNMIGWFANAIMRGYDEAHDRVTNTEEGPNGLSLTQVLSNAHRYKFEELRLLSEIAEYIDATYNQHYSKTKFQAAEFIFDGQHGTGFLIGNIMKYAQRYGKKDGYNRKDLLKIAHYALMLLYVHDTYNATEPK